MASVPIDFLCLHLLFLAEPLAVSSLLVGHEHHLVEHHAVGSGHAIDDAHEINGHTGVVHLDICGRKMAADPAAPLLRTLPQMSVLQ